MDTWVLCRSVSQNIPVGQYNTFNFGNVQSQFSTFLTLWLLVAVAADYRNSIIVKWFSETCSFLKPRTKSEAVRKRRNSLWNVPYNFPFQVTVQKAVFLDKAILYINWKSNQLLKCRIFYNFPCKAPSLASATKVGHQQLPVHIFLSFLYIISHQVAVLNIGLKSTI